MNNSNFHEPRFDSRRRTPGGDGRSRLYGVKSLRRSCWCAALVAVLGVLALGAYRVRCSESEDAPTAVTVQSAAIEEQSTATGAQSAAADEQTAESAPNDSPLEALEDGDSDAQGADDFLGTAPRKGVPGKTVESYLPSKNLETLDAESDLSSDAGELARPFVPDETAKPKDADAGFERLTPTDAPDDSKLSANETPWGRFAPGSWIRTRTVGTTFQFGKNIKSVTETKLTLVEIQSDGYLLKREVSIKMGVRTHAKDPEFVKYDFYGQPFDESATVETLKPANISLGRKVVPCRVRRFERTTPQGREETVVWYSSVTQPYIFQRSTEVYSPPTDDNPKGTLLSQSQTTIPRSTLNLRGVGESVNWRSQTVEKKSDSITLTKTVHSSRIPGGILRETAVESDRAGSLLYQSMTVLLDYYVK